MVEWVKHTLLFSSLESNTSSTSCDVAATSKWVLASIVSSSKLGSLKRLTKLGKMKQEKTDLGMTVLRVSGAVESKPFILPKCAQTLWTTICVSKVFYIQLKPHPKVITEFKVVCYNLKIQHYLATNQAFLLLLSYIAFCYQKAFLNFEKRARH